LSFSIAYPAWFLIFCPLAGAAYSLLFYYKDKRTGELPPFLKWLLAGLRFGVVTLLVFLLLSPLVKSTKNTTEKPIIVIAQDNSSSIITSKDSTFYKKGLKNSWDKNIAELSSKFDVWVMSFGNVLKDSMNYRYDEKETDISSALDEITRRYYGKNLGAVILSTDGIYNKGFDPLYAAHSLKSSLYTVAMGDTLVKRDAVVTKVEHNATAFLGNTFPMQVVIDVQKLEGKSSTLTVIDVTDKQEEKLFVKPLNFSSQSFHLNVPVQLKANTAGLKHYVVKLDPVEGEENLTNNRQDVYIHVLDEKQHILILSAPHPDVAAITESINSSESFEAETMLPDKFNGALNKYSLVILNQLPSQQKDLLQTLGDIKKQGIPVIYILGSQTDIGAFNRQNTGIKITAMGGRTTDAEASDVGNFSLFSTDDNYKTYAGRLPALATPFGSYQANPSVSVLFNQKIQSTVTNYPLISFNNTGTEKCCVIAGEGIFRWKLQDYLDHKNHDFFDGLITKIVQYLAVKDDKSFFRIHAANSYKEDEPVEMDAELYNPSYQLINDPEVTITITNSKNKNFAYTFTRTSNAYHLNAGMLQAGTYKYMAQVKAGTEVYTKKGEFTVTPVQLETTHTIADHHLLYQLANQHGGKMIFPNQLDELTKLLENRDDIKPIIYTHTSYSPIIDLKWIFFLLLILASAEWFIRKWNGTY
jgi:hypothetical protein